MAQRATSIGPKTILICFVLFLFCFRLFILVVGFCSFVFAFVLFGRVQGSSEVALGQPHLTLKSSLVVFVVCSWLVFGLFLFVLEWTKKPCFPPEKVIFFFICFLFHFPVQSFFSFLSFFLYILSYFVLFLSFFLSCFVSFFLLLSFSLSVFCFRSCFLFFLVLLRYVFLCLSFFSLFPCCFDVFLF